MSESSLFWDGTTVGDAQLAPYDAATEFAKVLISVGNTGSFANQGAVWAGELGGLAVTNPIATTIRVASGHALVSGTFYENTANIDTVLAAPVVSTRIDRFVLRKDWNTKTVKLVHLIGIEGGSAPALTQSLGNIWDIPVGQVSITTGSVVTLTDQREFVIAGQVPLPVAFGGTGITAIGDHQLIAGNGASAFSGIGPGTSGQVLSSAGAGSFPGFTSFAGDVTGPINALVVGNVSNTNGLMLPTVINPPVANALFRNMNAAFWVTFDSNGTIVASINLFSVTKNASQDFTINVWTGFANAAPGYCVIGSVMINNLTAGGDTVETYQASLAGNIHIVVYNPTGNFAFVCAVGFGVQ